ncbi:hypothetical protein CsSME_00006919 [Camellia sinensis var. sinensis]
MSPSSGSAVTGSQLYHAQLHQVGAMLEGQSHDEGGCKDRREAVDTQTEGRWADVADELALVVGPEVPCSGEVGVDVREEDDVSVTETEFQGEGCPSPVEVLHWVLSCINEVSQFLGVSFEGHEEEALEFFLQ